jgi:predicted MPP superfamily phosphohydrolase
MYVMRGVGTSGIPVRIGSRPEVFVLNIQGAKSIA